MVRGGTSPPTFVLLSSKDVFNHIVKCLEYKYSEKQQQLEEAEYLYTGRIKYSSCLLYKRIDRHLPYIS